MIDGPVYAGNARIWPREAIAAFAIRRFKRHYQSCQTRLACEMLV